MLLTGTHLEAQKLCEALGVPTDCGLVKGIELRLYSHEVATTPPTGPRAPHRSSRRH
jgi:hypothetical protein